MSDANDLTENEVVRFMAEWLRKNKFEVIKEKYNTQRGDDIEAVSANRANLLVECKGSISKFGNKLNDWNNSAMAIFGAIKEIEEIRKNDQHAIAVPNTEPYRKTIGRLNSFLVRQGIIIFWVDKDGGVTQTGSALPK